MAFVIGILLVVSAAFAVVGWVCAPDIGAYKYSRSAGFGFVVTAVLCPFVYDVPYEVGILTGLPHIAFLLVMGVCLFVYACDKLRLLGSADRNRTS